MTPQEHLAKSIELGFRVGRGEADAFEKMFPASDQCPLCHREECTCEPPYPDGWEQCGRCEKMNPAKNMFWNGHDPYCGGCCEYREAEAVDRMTDAAIDEQRNR